MKIFFKSFKIEIKNKEYNENLNFFALKNL